MSQPLPPEVRVVSTPTGVRYVLPRKPVLPDVRLRIRAALVAGVLAWALAGYVVLRAPPPFGFVLLAGGGVALAYAAAERFTHCRAEIGPDRLVLSEWRGPFALQRERSRDHIRAFAIHALPGAAAEAGAVTDTGGGVVEVVCAGVQPVWWGHGYSTELLGPLAAELARQCGVPHRRADRKDTPPPAVPPFAEPAAARDTDTADLPERPAGSRVVLERSPDRLTLTVPPLAAQRTDQVVAMWVLAGFWMLIPVVAFLVGVSLVLRQGLHPAAVWFFAVAIVVVGPAVVLFVYENTGARTTFTVRGGRLTRLKTSPVFAPERLSWRREEIFALRTITPRGGKGPPSVAVTLYPAVGTPVKLLESTAGEEMGWIATVLRRELGVPALPGQPVTPREDAPTPPPFAASAARRPPAPYPRLPLPPEIRVRTTPAGTHYVLPWARLGRQARLPCLSALALVALTSLVAGFCLCSGAHLPDWARQIGVVRGLGGLSLLGLGGILMLSVLGILVERSSVEIRAGEVRFRRRMGLLVNDQTWPIAHVRRLVTCPLAAGPGATDGEATGVMEVVGEGPEPLRFGPGYSLALLRPLAQELAERLHVPEEAGDTVADPAACPLRAAPAGTDEDVPDEDVADRAKPPAGSGAVVERSDDGLRVTLPPPGYQRDRRARVGLPFAVAACGFVALNGVAAGRLAVVGPPDPGEVAGTVAWLLGSIALAIILVLWVVRRGRCRTELFVTEKALAVVRSGPLAGTERREWPRGEVAALRVGTAVPVPHGGKGFALRVWLRDGRAVNVLTADDEAEVRWLATVLRQTLGVPALRA
jgi:hypothetical protein